MLGGICVSKQKRLKKQLGTGYQFEQRFSAKNLARMLRRLEGSNHFRVAAILSAGAVRLEAVVYWDNGKYSLGYDLLVKDTPFRACVPLSYIFSASIKRIITLLLFVKMQHLVACFELLSLYINGYKMATGKI